MALLFPPCLVTELKYLMDNDQVADILREIAVLLELKGENPFKSRAYDNAARTLENLREPLTDLVASKRLGTIKGFGDALQTKIATLVTTGRLPYYDDLKASVPAGLLEILQIQGLGPKKVKVLHDKLNVESIDLLEAACRNNQVATLPGFGAKTQAKILEGIEHHRSYASHHRLDDALAAAQPILQELRKLPEVTQCSLAGSLRRHKEIIGDIDFLASTNQPKSVLDWFVAHPQSAKILAQGDTKASIVLHDGLQADLRVVTNQEFPFALAYFTGSKEHNIAMRQRAIARGYRLNEYGLFNSKEETRDPKKRLDCASEKDIFAKLGLAYIEPELREDLGEFEAAEQGTLPQLLTPKDVRGSLHNHSDWSDGRQSLEQIIEDATSQGWDYWAVTDHSKSSFQANGLDAARLKQQIKEITQLNRQLEHQGKSFRLWSGSEVDILGDGQLDFPDDLLAQLDVVVASVHQGFTQSETEMTRRILRAVENPHVHILGHLTGRLLLAREGYRVNHREVIDACAATGTWIELNANPYRMDMDWRWWPYAKSKGVKCVLNCDAHRIQHADYMALGIAVARKGWLEKADVINTLTWKQLTKALAQKRTKRT